MTLSLLRRSHKAGLRVSVVVLLLVAFLGLSGTAQAATADVLTPLPDSINPLVTKNTLAPTAAPSGQTPITVAVTLNVRDAAALEAFISSASTPNTPNYGKFLTDAQFAAQFGPSSADAQRVVAYLHNAGIADVVAAPNNLVVTAKTTVTQAAVAFRANIGWFKTDDGRTVYANTTAPQLPASIARSIVGVVGLDNIHIAHTMNIRAAHAQPQTGPAGSTARPLTGSQLQTAYNAPTLFATGNKGTGHTVSLLIWGNYLESDIAEFVSQNGAAFSGGTPSVVRHLTGGDPGINDASIETYLDIESEMIMAPGSTIHAYIAPAPSFADLLTGLNTIITDDRDIISNSWGACETQIGKATLKSYHTAFLSGLAKGISILASSGDSGFAECFKTDKTGTKITSVSKGVSFPASDPLVLAVGGTRAYTDDTTGVVTNEAAWSCTKTDGTVPKKPTVKQCNRFTGDGGAGGGSSKAYKRPAYQKGLKGASGGRNLPDISFDADPHSGLYIYGRDNSIIYNGVVGGTSLASPLLAGVLVDGIQKLGGQRLGLFQNVLYAKGSTLGVDITQGNNGFPAKKGYDRATGKGSVGAGTTIGVNTFVNAIPAG